MATALYAGDLLLGDYKAFTGNDIEQLIARRAPKLPEIEAMLRARLGKTFS